MRTLIPTILALVIIGCTENPKTLKSGVWRGVLELQGQELPFNFSVVGDSSGNYAAFIKNAEENLLLDEIAIDGDTVSMTLHVFDSELRAAIKGDSLSGYFIKRYEKNYRIPFKAAYDQDYRFVPANEGPIENFTGTYTVTFVNESDTTDAVGLFSNEAGNIVTGSFLTSTGDYRYLEGNVIDGTMHLSTFDGNHAYLFTAEKTSDSTLAGEYWSGKTWHQTWTGVRNENASLPDAESLTYLKDGYKTIDFSFPDINGDTISLDDEKYKDKVVILQLSGTWCPNCMDETRFLTKWYDENKDRGVEVIGLAYEAKPDFNYASERVKKMIDKWDVHYDFVIAGTKDKAEASKTLPMLNRVVAFPTMIFIGKDGMVKKIHTGFSGPGTGIYYDQFIQHFNETVNELLSDNLASSK